MKTPTPDEIDRLEKAAVMTDPVIRVSTTLDPRFVEVAEELVIHPPGRVRDFFVRDLARALQRTVEDWMTVMERAANVGG